VAIASSNNGRKVFLQKGRFLKKGVWVGRWLWYREKWKTLKGMRDISGCCWICRSMSRYSQLEELKQDPVFQLFCNNKSVLLLFHHYAPVSFVIEAWSPCALTLLCFQIHLIYELFILITCAHFCWNISILYLIMPAWYQKIDGGEDVKKKGHGKENDSDFLSSIEVGSTLIHILPPAQINWRSSRVHLHWT
jgi:hypothetical protein